MRYVVSGFCVQKEEKGDCMLTILEEFREILDEIMLKAMHSSVLLYGYESYTGRFIKWYAEYYHNIKIDYLVSTDMGRGRAYDQEIFRPSIINFNYKNVRQAIIWVAEPMTDDLRRVLNTGGIQGENCFDIYGAIYGSDIYGNNEKDVDVFRKKKEGRRDIQFLEWLEWKYGCNFVTRVHHDFLEVAGEHGSGYGCTTQKEIFPILDCCHCIPQADDAIFDFGCGKGGALISFLDYGFQNVGGIEYEPKIYDVLKENMSRLGLESRMELLYGDASELREELDTYNWFYFFLPFDNYIFERYIKSICDSRRRKRRKLHIINISPYSHDCIEKTGVFRLTNQFTIDTRQRVVNVYESYDLRS